MSKRMRNRTRIEEKKDDDDEDDENRGRRKSLAVVVVVVVAAGGIGVGVQATELSLTEYLYRIGSSILEWDQYYPHHGGLLGLFNQEGIAFGLIFCSVLFCELVRLYLSLS
ncbi:hypothetical protein M0802_010305 [Mischocyttarus mexicanus]|nr:hypothetical protein M0802_010305 [Mischocyttarus mexicanus]